MKSIKILAVLIALLLGAILIFWKGHDAVYYYQKGCNKLAAGDYSSALTNFDKAIQIKPDYADAYIARGRTKYQSGTPDGAMADYSKAAEIRPDLLSVSDLSRSPDTTITNKIGKEAVAFLESRDYDKLDGLAAKLRASKECYADGVWKLACVYDGLVPSNRESNEAWEARLLAIERWAVERPDSITARIAWANILVAYAWKARGAGRADTVSRTGWQLFGQRLIESAKVLKEAKALNEHCPLYWSVLMRDALGLQMDKTRFNSIFNEAIKSEPDCEAYYYRRAIYLLPQWYGDEGQWQRDLTESADKAGGENGDMLYARVVWNMHQRYNVNPFWDGNFSWARLNRGFTAIEKHFPDVLAARIEQAQLAIFFKEKRAADFYNNGLKEQHKGDFNRAIKDYTRAIKLNPNYARAYGNRANARRSKGDLDGSLADLNKAIEIQTNYVIAFYNRALTKQAKGDRVGAMADFNKAIQFGPDFAAGYAGRAALKQANGDYEGAIADFSKAIDLRPGFVQDLYTARANLRRFMGDRSGAMADFTQAAKYSKIRK